MQSVDLNNLDFDAKGIAIPADRMRAKDVLDCSGGFREMITEENKQLVRNFVDIVINNRNLDAAGDYMAEDMVELVPFPGQGPGLSGLKDVLRGMFAAFPDMHWTIEEQIAEGASVLTRFTWTGTHNGEFFSVPASGLKVSVWGMVIDSLEHGKIKRSRILMDALGLMQQIGG